MRALLLRLRTENQGYPRFSDLCLFCYEPKKGTVREKDVGVCCQTSYHSRTFPVGVEGVKDHPRDRLPYEVLGGLLLLGAQRPGHDRLCAPTRRFVQSRVLFLH